MRGRAPSEAHLGRLAGQASRSSRQRSRWPCAHTFRMAGIGLPVAAYHHLYEWHTQNRVLHDGYPGAIIHIQAPHMQPGYRLAK